MRTCEGGGENPFCYHRVATLAQRKARRSRPRYVPMVIAPAALLAMFGLGCGGNVAVDERSAQGAGGAAQDAGLSDAAIADQAAPDAVAETEPPVIDHYGIPPTDAGDSEPPIVDPYGVADAGPDVPNVDFYGIMPDAEADGEPPVVDPYGVWDAEADVEPPFADLYGEPPPDGG